MQFGIGKVTDGGARCKLRVLHVVPYYQPAFRYGGPIYSVHQLARAQVARGHDVHVFTTNIDGVGDLAVPLGRATDQDGVRVTYFPPGAGRRLFRSPAMGKALREQIANFDLLHLHTVWLWPTACAAFLARRNGVPYLLAPRGMLVDDLIRRKNTVMKRAWIVMFERRNIERAAAVHVTSELEASELGALGLRAEKICMLPNGVDLP